jgi:hypothetical protein
LLLLLLDVRNLYLSSSQSWSYFNYCLKLTEAVCQEVFGYMVVGSDS